MGVNGIYGLSGSGLDIESLVKVGMMSRQNEYDKMAQKYTKNEWLKAAYLDTYNTINTFNVSSLTDYKMQANMNARTVESTDPTVRATATAKALLTSHTVAVDQRASNAYLISTNKLTRYDTDKGEEGNAGSFALKDVLFKDLKLVGGKLYGDIAGAGTFEAKIWGTGDSLTATEDSFGKQTNTGWSKWNSDNLIWDSISPNFNTGLTWDGEKFTSTSDSITAGEVTFKTTGNLKTWEDNSGNTWTYNGSTAVSDLSSVSTAKTWDATINGTQWTYDENAKTLTSKNSISTEVSSAKYWQYDMSDSDNPPVWRYKTNSSGDYTTNGEWKNSDDTWQYRADSNAQWANITGSYTYSAGTPSTESAAAIPATWTYTDSVGGSWITEKIDGATNADTWTYKSGNETWTTSDTGKTWAYKASDSATEIWTYTSATEAGGSNSWTYKANDSAAETWTYNSSDSLWSSSDDTVGTWKYTAAADSNPATWTYTNSNDSLNNGTWTGTISDNGSGGITTAWAYSSGDDNLTKEATSDDWNYKVSDSVILTGSQSGTVTTWKYTDAGKDWLTTDNGTTWSSGDESWEYTGSSGSETWTYKANNNAGTESWNYNATNGTGSSSDGKLSLASNGSWTYNATNEVTWSRAANSSEWTYTDTDGKQWKSDGSSLQYFDTTDNNWVDGTSDALSGDLPPISLPPTTHPPTNEIPTIPTFPPTSMPPISVPDNPPQPSAVPADPPNSSAIPTLVPPATTAPITVPGSFPSAASIFSDASRWSSDNKRFENGDFFSSGTGDNTWVSTDTTKWAKGKEIVDNIPTNDSGSTVLFAFSISDGVNSDRIKIKYTYDQLTTSGDATLGDLAKRINDEAKTKNLNIQAVYDHTYDTFSIYNTESGSANQIKITLGDGDSTNNTDERVAQAFFNNLGLYRTQDGELYGNDGKATTVYNAGSSTKTTAGENNYLQFKLDGENTFSGTDNIVRIDGISYTTDENKITVGDITYDTAAAAKGTTAMVSVTQDVEGIVEKVKSFVSDYNKILAGLYEKYDEKTESGYSPLTQSQKDSMKDEQIEKWEEKAKAGLLYHDQTIGKIINNMRNTVSAAVDGIESVEVNGQKYTYNSAYSLGISTEGIKGQLKLDENKLRVALANDPNSVYNVFGVLVQTKNAQDKTVTDTSKSGIAQRLADVFNEGINSIKTRSGTSAEVYEDSDLNNLLRQLQTKMSNFKKMMTAFEDRLYKKYDAMESALAKLGTQLNFIMGTGQ